MSKVCMKITDLSVGYGDNGPILKNINIDLFEGQFIPLLGPNGIGKTTFVKSLFGLIDKKHGSIELYGKPIEEYSMNERASYIAMSLSESLNTGLMTSEEFVSLGILARTADPENLISKYFKKLDINELKYKQFNELSDGEREWVKLARVLIQQTKIIFLDEPMGHLDISGKVKMISILSNHTKETGASILMSSHDWSTIRKFSSYIYVIDQKGVFKFLSPEDLILTKKLNTIYPLQTNSMFEDNQGEISLKIEPIFTLDIESNNPIKTFWLKHALAKMGYAENHSNYLGVIKIYEEEFVLTNNRYKTIYELMREIKSLLAQL
ncbi:MAG: ABC transporter ATP-binding protein [Bacteriovoracaceae bacterium]|jgi:iron complex transport system ATP-binding protein|nr:ABC transporter ATP-binding protein [Bacteriovoracaceae bacterium]